MINHSFFCCLQLLHKIHIIVNKHYLYLFTGEKMTRLYFVRHGKTQWNLEGRYQGAHGDSPLLPTSINEIKRLATYLHGIKFAHIYTSPLSRTITTAKLLDEGLGGNIPITVEQALREFDLGKMEGMTFKDVEKKYPEEVYAFRQAPAQYFPQRRINGETFTQLINRMTPMIQRAVHADTTGHANLIFVGHGAAFTATIQALLGTPLADLRKDGGLTNSSVTIIETNDNGATYHLIKWNETSFLWDK